MMVNWQTKKLGDIGRIAMCKRIMKDQTSAHGDIPFYKIGTFGKNPDAYISSELYENYKSKYSFPKIGEILISASGTIGRAVVYDGSPAYFQDSNIVWLAHDESVVLNKFLGYAYTRVNWQTDSGTIARLYNDNFRRVTIKVPEKPEQERIVGVLEVWDEYIEKLEQKIALKEQLKKGLMQQLLTGRVRGFDYKWSYTSLSSFASKSKNAIVDGPFGSQMKLSEFTATGVPVIEMHHLKNTYIKKSSLRRFVSEDKFNKDLKRSGVYGGDIIISKTGSLGYLGLIEEGERAVITSRLAKITIDREKAHREFVFQYLKYMKMIGYWERIGQGGTMKILSIDNFKKMPIPNISKKEQLKIASILALADEEINTLRDKRSHLVNQKKYLLKNLITGTIRTPEDLQPLDTSRLERSAL